MFDFDSVIENGSYDDFKECVFAVVSLEPIPKPFELRLTSIPIVGRVRGLRARWTVEAHQDLMAVEAFYDIQAERVMMDAMRNAYEVQNNPVLRREPRRNRKNNRGRWTCVQC